MLKYVQNNVLHKKTSHSVFAQRIQSNIKADQWAETVTKQNKTTLFVAGSFMMGGWKMLLPKFTSLLQKNSKWINESSLMGVVIVSHVRQMMPTQSYSTSVIHFYQLINRNMATSCKIIDLFSFKQNN